MNRFRFALRLGWLCQPATQSDAQSVFCDVHTAAKTDWIFFAPLRRRALCETVCLLAV